jgi:two-component SAPR family response regulator
VTWKEGGSIRRERINYSLLIRNTEKNIRLAREINELYKRRRKLYKQCNDLNSKIYALQDKLEHLSAKDIGYGDQR